MKLAFVDQLAGGEVLAREILTSDYQVLLGEGTALKPEYISKLKELHILSVYIKDDPKQAEALENNILNEQVRKDCLIKVRDILQQHIYHKNSELHEIDETAEKIIENILCEEHVIKKVYEVKTRSFDLYEHSLSVCSLAILMALRLKVSEKVVHEIGIAGLLHDLGMMYITVDYNGKDIGTLPVKQQEEYRKHTVYGYSALAHEDWIPDSVKKMILSHHERVGGQGYPLHIQEPDIACQILALCEVFDERLCGVGSVKIKVYEAIEYVKSLRGNGFDRQVVDALLEFAAVYPTGTKVRLSSGEIGIVVSQNENFPDRPNVRLLSREDEKDVQNGKIIDLLKILNLVITEVLD